MITNDTADIDKDILVVEHDNDNGNDNDDNEDIVMELEFANMSKEKEQSFIEIINAEEKMNRNSNSNSNSNNTTVIRCGRSSLSLMGVSSLSFIGVNGDGDSDGDSSNPDSDSDRRRGSSIISFRPSIMSKETADKVLDLLKEIEQAEQESNYNNGYEYDDNDDGNGKSSSSSSSSWDDNIEQQGHKLWDELSVEQKIKKIKCAAAGGGLVLLGIITTPTPFPTLPFIAAGIHILGNEYEQAKEVEDTLLEKVDSAKTKVIQKYEEYSSSNNSSTNSTIRINNQTYIFRE